jgi:hypothetical protein
MTSRTPNVDIANKYKEIITKFKLPKGYSISFPDKHVFPDGYVTSKRSFTPIIALNFNEERIALLKFSVVKKKTHLSYVQGVKNKLKVHPEWIDFLLEPFIFTGIVIYGSASKFKDNFLFTGFNESKKSLNNTIALYECNIKYIKDKNKKINLERNLEISKAKVSLYSKIRDKYFDKNGALNLSKERIKHLDTIYSQVKTKPNFTIYKEHRKRPLIKHFRK